MDDLKNIEVEGFLFDHFPADEHFKMRESCEKEIIQLYNRKVLEARENEVLKCEIWTLENKKHDEDGNVISRGDVSKYLINRHVEIVKQLKESK